VPAAEPAPAETTVESVEAIRAEGLATATPDRVPVKGRPRSFWACVGLGVVTLGLYFWYWQWQVFREVHQQERTRPMAEVLMAALLFTLAGGGLGLLAGRDGGEGLARWATGAALAGTVLQASYLVLETRRFDRVLRACELRATGAAGWLAVAGVLGALIQWSSTPGPGQTILGLVALAVALVGFFLLQDGLNRYWAHERSGAPLATPTGLSAMAS
jgi:hypothetical protein